MATAFPETLTGFRINTPPADFQPQKDLPEGFLDFLAPLHRKFSPWRSELIEDRRLALDDSHAGSKPVFGKNLKAAFPKVNRARPWAPDGEVRPYVYQGLGVKK